MGPASCGFGRLSQSLGQLDWTGQQRIRDRQTTEAAPVKLTGCPSRATPRAPAPPSLQCSRCPRERRAVPAVCLLALPRPRDRPARRPVLEESFAEISSWPALIGSICGFLGRRQAKNEPPAVPQEAGSVTTSFLLPVGKADSGRSDPCLYAHTLHPGTL